MTVEGGTKRPVRVDGDLLDAVNAYIDGPGLRWGHRSAKSFYSDAGRRRLIHDLRARRGPQKARDDRPRGRLVTLPKSLVDEVERRLRPDRMGEWWDDAAHELLDELRRYD